MADTYTARFGHHPDPAIDYCVEVQCIEAMCADQKLTGRCFNDDDTPCAPDGLERRIRRAEGFRPNVRPDALAARRVLLRLSDEILRGEAQ